MPKAAKPKKSPGPPRRGSKWSAIWDDMVSKFDVVDEDDEGGWAEFKCGDSREAQLCQSALHQRSLREQADWRVQTHLDGDKIYFRRVWVTEDQETE